MFPSNSEGEWYLWLYPIAVFVVVPIVVPVSVLVINVPTWPTCEPIVLPVPLGSEEFGLGLRGAKRPPPHPSNPHSPRARL